MYKNKKASLSLSINAIVVLILAITMLGLGLGFVRGMFSKVGAQVEGMVEEEPEPPTAIASDPIQVSRTAVVAQRGESITLRFSIYNNGASAIKPEPNEPTNCGLVSLDSSSREIDAGTVGVITAIFKAGTSTGKTICSMTMTDLNSGNDIEGSKDVTVSLQ